LEGIKGFEGYNTDFAHFKGLGVVLGPGLFSPEIGTDGKLQHKRKQL
jgi:hypothetical protein